MKTIFFVLCGIFASAQTLTLHQAVDAANRNNIMLRTAAYEVSALHQLRRASTDLPKTQLNFLQGQYNSITKGDNNISILQTIPSTVWGSQAALNKSLAQCAVLKQTTIENSLVYEVNEAYYQLSFLKAQHALLARQDSIYSVLLTLVHQHFASREIDALEKVSAEAQYYEVKNLIHENGMDIVDARNRLQMLINSDFLPDIPDHELSPIVYSETTIAESTNNPSLFYLDV